MKTLRLLTLLVCAGGVLGFGALSAEGHIAKRDKPVKEKPIKDKPIKTRAY